VTKTQGSNESATGARACGRSNRRGRLVGALGLAVAILAPSSLVLLDGHAWSSAEAQEFSGRAGAQAATVRAETDSTDGDAASAHSALAGGCEVTWAVFSNVGVPLSFAQPPAPCNGDAQMGNVTVDLDGDGVDELLRADDWEPGQPGDGMVRCLRRVAGTLRDEGVLSWDPADTAFPWVPSAQQSSFVVDPSGLFDCDGDGRNDLVVRTIYYTPNAVIQYGYFRNILPPPQSSSAADINRDGVVNGADLTLLLVAWAGGG
jgi:hypothetical protein